MVKHEFTFYDNLLSVDGQIGQKTEIIVPGTDIIIPDELAINFKDAIDDTKDAAISVINQNSLPNQIIYIDSNYDIGERNIEFFIADKGVLKNIEAEIGISKINAIQINGETINLPILLGGSASIIVNCNVTYINQRLKLTILPYSSVKTYNCNSSPRLVSTFPIAGAFWVPEFNKMLFQGFNNYTSNSYIFTEDNVFYDNPPNMGGYRAYNNYIYINQLQLVYLIVGTNKIAPYYPLQMILGSPLTLSGTVYSFAYNYNNYILYVGTSTNLYAINPLTNTILATYNYDNCYSLTYMHNGSYPYLYIGRYAQATNNPIIINLDTFQQYNYNLYATSYNIMSSAYDNNNKRLFVSIYYSGSGNLGRIYVINMDSSSPTFLQVIATINNIYGYNILLVNNYLYNSTPSGVSLISKVNINTYNIETITSLSPAGINLLIYHPALNKIMRLSQNGFLEYINL